MKIYKTITTSLNRFRTRSITHTMSFKWNGSTMTYYQNGSKFVISDLFTGCFMPKKVVKGVLFPSEISELIEIQQYMDDNIDDLMISPTKWGYDIYKISSGSRPLLAKELRFYSVKGIIPSMIASFIFKDVRIALKNV